MNNTKLEFTLIEGKIFEKTLQNQKITLNELVKVITGEPCKSFLKMRELTKAFVLAHPNKYPKELFTSHKYTSLKRSQSAFVFGGWIPKSHNKDEMIPNGCIQLDLDIKSDGGDLLAKKICDILSPICVFCVISSSTFGVKCLIRTDLKDTTEWITSIITKGLSFVVLRHLKPHLTDLELKAINVDSLVVSQPCFIPYSSSVTVHEGNIWPISGIMKEIVKNQLYEQKKERERIEKKSKDRLGKVSIDKLKLIEYGLHLAYHSSKNHGSGFAGTHQAHLKYSTYCILYGIDVETAWGYLIGKTKVGCTFRHFEKMYTPSYVNKNFGFLSLELEVLFLENKERQYNYRKEEEKKTIVKPLKKKNDA